MAPPSPNQNNGMNIVNSTILLVYDCIDMLEFHAWEYVTPSSSLWNEVGGGMTLLGVD